MTSGLIPKSHFLTAGTDPNVTFGQCHLTSQIIFTDQWHNVTTNKPPRRLWPGVAALDNKIYFTGGSYGQCDVKRSVHCFDPDTNTWSQKSDMNIARRGHCLVSLHGRLYAIGGEGVDSDEVYDPDTDTWTQLQHKRDCEVLYCRAGLIKKGFINKVNNSN